MTGNTPPLVVILGPTAVGKTGLAIHLAQALNGEIISADSRQIYRKMDIGTAKPTAQQCAACVHHLIDVVEPDEDLGLAQYQALAYTAIAEIHARGKVPFLVGGTGQYITAVIEGWSIPQIPPNPSLRNTLEQFAVKHGAAALYARLQAIDPEAANAIHMNNIRRVIRALEVYLESGQTITALQRKRPPAYRIRQYGLTLPREMLYAQADQRFDQMMDEGFLAEVQHLLSLGYNRKLPSMSGLGYAELSAHLLDAVPLEDAIASSKTNTHDFIRRQYTWFRGHDDGILWHDVQSVDRAALVAELGQWLEETS